MDIRASDGAERHLRRYLLALRLFAYQVRTGTITAMTKLSRHQQETLRARWGFTDNTRRRGQTPTSLERFIHSPRARSESAALAAFCRVYDERLRGDLPGASRQTMLTLELGERMIPAYEAFRACFPECEFPFEELTEFQLEDLLNFVVRIAKDDDVGLDCCASCGATVLLDKLSADRPMCGRCHRVQPQR